MWQKFLWSAPSLHANSLAVLSWKENKGQTVGELAGQLQKHKGSFTSSLWACTSAVEKLPDTLAEKLSENCPKSSSDSRTGSDPTCTDQCLSWRDGSLPLQV